jgi:hypothetical protein
MFIHYACETETIIEDSDAKLEFSRDTVRFDTVFTEVGSATRSFRIRNPHSERIVISAIELGGQSSQFRLNIDGVPTSSASDVTILPNDSLWVFVEVTVDPDMPLSASPYVIEEQVFFLTNGNEQVVQLEAWGQNANYIPNRFSSGEFTRLSCDNDSLRFDDPKPYVIYGVLIIDSCHVALPPGTEIYVHGGLARTDEDVIFNDGLIAFTNNASLQSQGTIDNPVLITGDRLESEFEDVSGQWSGIRFLAGSRGNRITNTKITNSLVGLRVDSSSFLRMENVEVLNTAGPGLIGVHSTILGENVLIADNGSFSGLFQYGGNYSFFNSTFANYQGQSSAIRLDNFICIGGDCSNGALTNRLNANFTNCILFGNDADEIQLQDVFEGQEPSQFNYTLTNCIVAVNELLDADQFPTFFDNCDNCINATLEDELFLDQQMRDYHLDTMSIAIGQAIPLDIVERDLEGNERDLSTPDIGCYEFVE